MTDKPRVVLGADHLGRVLKDTLRDHLIAKGYQVEDMGVASDDAVDYPDIGFALAERVAKGEFPRGILVCGTGAGMAICANKVAGVRAACVMDPHSAERAIASNDAHVITFGSQITGPEVAKKLTDIWLASDFQGGRSAPKVGKITAGERRLLSQPASE
ncbi:RpiB/LacA/LacB family sugar-phosphate isomerase [Rhodovibrio salinarum]|uniref:Ribose 5-phosphate isomerase B n=1 Tax=Rhodovibrio salinarum TaxID=1087 RepID=A0A934QH25_9PROT|nr:RpiB/LacA/LacB family sugar-phosphate isomerase [Rhodovibrio salinarum]MBK1696410.1 ribose 5-phosphate isomerase B [Rhodovibrio salinarum]